MKIKEYKNKIVLAELDPDAKYLILVVPYKVQLPIELPQGIDARNFSVVHVEDVDKTIKFVEIPK